MVYLFWWSAAQIILESLPISSSGHNRLCMYMLPTSDLFFSEPFSIYFNYALHLPTAILILLFFFPRWFMPFRFIKHCWRLVIKISFLTFLADVVTVLGYGLMLTANIHMPLSVGFFITMVSLYSLRWCTHKHRASWNIKKAIILGAIQAVAFIPGFSRFALTYVAARWMAIPSRRSFEISFLIQWPLIVLASCYSIYLFFHNIIELLSLPYLSVMLGASMIAYGLLYVVLFMSSHQYMWLWSLYMLIPLLISFYKGGT